MRRGRSTFARLSGGSRATERNWLRPRWMWAGSVGSAYDRATDADGGRGGPFSAGVFPAACRWCRVLFVALGEQPLRWPMARSGPRHHDQQDVLRVRGQERRNAEADDEDRHVRQRTAEDLVQRPWAARPAGPAGAQGAAGPAGPGGAEGAKGDTGATGAAGPKGDTGATGAAGPKGDTGAAGAAGPKGDTGSSAASMMTSRVDIPAGICRWALPVRCDQRDLTARGATRHSVTMLSPPVPIVVRDIAIDLDVPAGPTNIEIHQFFLEVNGNRATSTFCSIQGAASSCTNTGVALTVPASSRLDWAMLTTGLAPAKGARLTFRATTG